MDKRIEAALEILRSEYERPLKVREIAKRAHLGHSRFALLFRKETGLTAKACLRKVRLRRAAELLAEDGLSVKQVAYSVGYRDPSRFDQEFKSSYGQPPSFFRHTTLSATGEWTR